MDDRMILLDGNTIGSILYGKEKEAVEVIQEAYIAHSKGMTSLPHSTFLRFPEQPGDRIIGLPAYVGDDKPVAGMKWIASFPENIMKNIPRASAVLILNNMKNGRPYAVLEGSLISAARTAASAALAVLLLADESINEAAVIGCGPINATICRFVSVLRPRLKTVHLLDISKDRAEKFGADLKAALGLDFIIHETLEEAVKGNGLVSIATNAGVPHIDDSAIFDKKSLILHISLRDLSPEIIRSSVNVVDDFDHVNREMTSIHLASQQTGGDTSFVHATIGDLADGHTLEHGEGPVIFSPFGLGILDVKLGQFVYEKAMEQERGLVINNFFPGL